MCLHELHLVTSLLTDTDNNESFTAISTTFT